MCEEFGYTWIRSEGEMRLTDKQENLVARYLRDVSSKLERLPIQERDRALARLRLRIVRALRGRGRHSLDDAQVEAVLDEFGPASEQAQRLTTERADDGPSLLSKDNRRWLGVCGGLAERYGWEPGLLRALVVLMGLFTGPFLLIVYLGVYFVAHSSADDATASVDKWKLVKHVLFVVAGAGALHLGAHGFHRFLHLAYGWLFTDALVLSGPWAWLPRFQSDLLFWTLFFCLPIAILAALPVPEPWSVTLKKVFQAGLALYALALCYGMACALVGAILQATANMGDIQLDLQSFMSRI